jgi:hypothetical protein
VASAPVRLLPGIRFPRFGARTDGEGQLSLASSGSSTASTAMASGSGAGLGGSAASALDAQSGAAGLRARQGGYRGLFAGIATIVVLAIALGELLRRRRS